MLTNEQRAHDLAIAVLLSLKDELMQELVRNSEQNSSKLSFDYYAEYKKIYEGALNAFNRDFPLDE